MATYVVSDIHGYYFRLQDLLNKVQFSNNDQLYVLGDIIDRGPHNGEMIEGAYKQKSNVHFLLGNHEDMMLSALNIYPDLKNSELKYAMDIWMMNGGYNTFLDLTSLGPAEIQDDFLNGVNFGPAYYDITVNNRRFILIHGGFHFEGIRFSTDFFAYGKNQLINIKDFPEEEELKFSLWARKEWYFNKRELPCDVISGHTPTKFIYEDLKEYNYFADSKNKIITFQGYPNHILHINKKHFIDTGRKIMGLLRLDDMKEFYSDIKEIDEDIK